MNPVLAKWIRDADALRHFEHFSIQSSDKFTDIKERTDDYYLSLVGELFGRLRENNDESAQWARLGNAFALFSDEKQQENLASFGISRSETALFSAAAFYFGGFPASAYLMAKTRSPAAGDDTLLGCFDLLARPRVLRSKVIHALLASLRRGDHATIDAMLSEQSEQATSALDTGPTEWIHARLLHQLLARFHDTNVRAVLPDGHEEFWNPLVDSFLNRQPPAWEFFPSQIQAIQRGLLARTESFSLQMPTGAGKTALCETLLYWHLKRGIDDAAILLVPYRSLASELRATLAKRLTSMGISTRCVYGGTVPTGDEVRSLENTRAMIATPESLSGLLGTSPEFFRRVSLVICDEGHLLDGGARGVGLELLLARMMVRESGSPRFVFVSAIVPNIEEINAWLGGADDSVVRSDYRPALAEFGLLLAHGSGANGTLDLAMHPHEKRSIRYTIENFLGRNDFTYVDQRTRRSRTYPFDSLKTQAVATARKALPMGGAAIFAANKRGNQGAIGIAEEIIKQMLLPLPLPKPIDFGRAPMVEAATDYLAREYGSDWVGTKALSLGVVLHHGDIPQETREVLEILLRHEDAKLAVCTSTLAEGVNLPIRTLVLYSVRRVGKGGEAENMLTRDIKNLVGRAGRAGATTKGLVICANEKQWPLVERVAEQASGEPVTGALRSLVERLHAALAREGLVLTNALLESTPDLHALVDGVDSTLIDLATEEVGEDMLVEIAMKIAGQTLAARQVDADTNGVLRSVFELRARRVSSIRSQGRLEWLRETGARARVLDSVESDLLPRHLAWDEVSDALDPDVVGAFIEWAWPQAEIQTAVRDSYRLGEDDEIDSVRDAFTGMVWRWLRGESFVATSEALERPVDDLLGVHATAVAFVFQTLVEQGAALLAKLLESQGRVLSPSIAQFPEHLRFGVPTPVSCTLAAGGLRHRRAAVELGLAIEQQFGGSDSTQALFVLAHRMLLADREKWRQRFGKLVLFNTLADLASVTGAEHDEGA